MARKRVSRKRTSRKKRVSKRRTSRKRVSRKKSKRKSRRRRVSRKQRGGTRPSYLDKKRIRHEQIQALNELRAKEYAAAESAAKLAANKPDPRMTAAIKKMLASHDR